jgi:soluble lytic murein transglycosylase-like protein
MRSIYLLWPLVIAQFGWLTGSDSAFEPRNRLSGIGVDRQNISDAVLQRRIELMTESQTFGILRDPRALEGAKRVTSPAMQKLFDQAGERSALPSSLIQAVAYLESWGMAKAESPAGPKGIMQIAEATGRSMGLKITRATRYHVVTERKQVKNKRGKVSTRTVKRRIPYQVVVRDERLIPDRAVPAAANYLARLENKFGSRDWAVFAYHCGEGCVSAFRSRVRDSGEFNNDPTFARVFFSTSPALNRELYESIQYHMERDYSPTYWFRIMRAQELLSLYKREPQEFEKLFRQFRYEENPLERAPNRLSVWLKEEDLLFKTCEDIRKDQGKRLVKALDDPKLFGFTLRKTGAGAIGALDLRNQEYYLQASPAAIGTLTYIAFETRRLHEAMKPKGEKFVPLEVTGLVQPLDYPDDHKNGKRSGFPAHCTGQVFDINYNSMPTGQREALRFVLDDLGWHGYLGFVEEHRNSGVLHIGCSPSSREFFTKIFEEALSKKAS